MGCGNCGTASNGKPSGCKSNGGCSTGGCNRLNVYNWLSALPLHDGAKPYPVIEVSFNKGSRKDFFRNNTNNILEKGQWIAVEGISGFDLGQVSLTGELVKLQMKKYSVNDPSELKRVLRLASEEDLKQCNINKDREPEVLIRARAIARSLNLEMKLAEVELQADGKKGTFFYTADQRVDFRELIKIYASEFKLKVEMRQIGARQESGKVGGIGSCGRELCCSTWLTDFKSVNTTAARYQNLSINQTKLSGQCGRLKCCLNYELDTYLDALKVFPDHADTIETIKGVATLQKRDIFKNLMWYSYADSNKQYPLTIVRVKEILDQNRKGIKPDELQAVELETNANKAGIKIDVGFVNDVGQMTLKALEKGNKKKKSGSSNKNRPQPAQQQNASAGQTPQRQAQQQRGPQQPNRQQGNRPQGDRPQGEKPQGNRPQGDRPQGNRLQGDRPQQEARPQGNAQPRPERPPQKPHIDRNKSRNRPNPNSGQTPKAPEAPPAES